MRLLFFLILLTTALFLACSGAQYCDDIGMVEISSELQSQAQKTGFPYCHITKKALQKDKDALSQLIRFAYKTDDYTAIEHGIVFCQVLLELGDAYVYQFMQTQNEAQQLLSAKMIDTAIEFAEPPLPLREELPKSTAFLLGE